MGLILACCYVDCPTWRETRRGSERTTGTTQNIAGRVLGSGFRAKLDCVLCRLCQRKRIKCKGNFVRELDLAACVIVFRL